MPLWKSLFFRVGAHKKQRSDLFFQPSCYFSPLSCTYPITIMNWFGESIQGEFNGTNYCRQRACVCSIFLHLLPNNLLYFSKNNAIQTKGKNSLARLLYDMRSQEPSHGQFVFLICIYNLFDFMTFYCFLPKVDFFSSFVRFSLQFATKHKGEGVACPDCRTNTLVNDEKRKRHQPRIWSCLLSGTSKSENNQLFY